MALETWLAFVAASAALLAVPGPTVLLVLSYAIGQGRRVALATVAGVSLGDFVAMSASLAGLGALILASAELFTILKWIGAAYLIYIGLRLFRSAARVPRSGTDHLAQTHPRAVFAHAAAVTALNPKSIAFFIAFVPQFVAPDAPLMPQFVILIATFVTLAGLNALAYALLADRIRKRLARPAVTAAISRLGAAALVAMGLATAFARRTPA